MLSIDTGFAAKRSFDDEVDRGLTAVSGQGITLPVVITLDDEVVLRADFVGVHSASCRYASLPEQTNFHLDRRLPRLLTARMWGNPSFPVQRPNQNCDFSVWLSDRSSGFSPFPDQGDSNE